MINEALSRQVNVRERLPRDLRRIGYVAAWVMAVFAVFMIAYFNVYKRSFGVDSHAYWLAWRGSMYTDGPVPPGWVGLNPYLYSPAFAQALWPMAQLPWAVFGVLFSVIDAAVLVWLLKPLGWAWGIPVYLVLLPEVLNGNIFVLLGAMAVFGFRYPASWALAALTKVAPTVMPFWWLVRRESRPLATWGAVTLGIAIVSAGISPGLWVSWFEHLWLWSHSSTKLLGSNRMVPLIYRAPLGLLLVVVGARKGWRWSVPTGALLCTPVFWLGSYAWLAAIPRIQSAQKPRPFAAEYSSPGPREIASAEPQC